MADPTATEMLSLYLAAEVALLKGKAFTLNGESLTREDLAEVIKGRQEWERRAASAREVSLGRQRGIALADFSGPRT